MNNTYRFTLQVQCPDGKHYARRYEVEAEEAPELEPYDLCESPLVAMAVDGLVPESIRRMRIDHDRAMLAKQIANNLTVHILDSLKQRDTLNGYQKQ